MSKITNGFYEFGPFRLDAARQLLLRDGHAVPLTSKSFETLLVLMQHSEHIVSKDELMKLLWPDTFVEESNLTQHISMLRKALGESPQDRRYIVTMPGRGYRFAQKVREVSDCGDLIVQTHSIERVIIEESESSQNSAALAPISSLPKRPRSWKFGAATAFGVLFVASAVFWLGNRQPKSLPTAAEMKLRQLTTNTAEDSVVNGAISPDGMYLAYADAQGMHIKLIETGETRAVPQPDALDGKNAEWKIIQQWFPDSTRFLAEAHPSGESPALWSSEGSSIWVVSVLGGPPHKLRDKAIAYSVSPDGSLIAFGTNRGSLGEHEIWLMRSDGEQARKFLEAKDNSAVGLFHWFPNGKRVWYGSTDKYGTTLVTRELYGGPVTTILPASEMRKIWDVTLLPDHRLLYTLPELGAGSTCNYWVMRLDEQTGAASKPKRLTDWGGSCPFSTSVTADGKKLTFLKWVARFPIFVADLEANGEHISNSQPFAPSEGWNDTLDWTGDSRGIIFKSNRNGHFGIFKQALDGETPEPLVSGPKDVADGRISPDGTWVVYFVSTGEDLTSPVQIMRVPITGGPSQLVLTAQPSSDFRCARSPSAMCVISEAAVDGKQFVLTAFEPLNGRRSELARIDVDTTVKGLQWDLSPDGTRIAFLRSPQSPIEILSLHGNPVQVVHVKNFDNLESLNWAADGNGFFISNPLHGEAILLHADLEGNAHVLRKNQGGTWTIGRPSPDGRRLAIQDFRIEGNIWTMENF
jgi:DNA-binding winged helix-turn-helix (wHTH) protein/Tol biopolymer transport system component